MQDRRPGMAKGLAWGLAATALFSASAVRAEPLQPPRPAFESAVAAAKAAMVTNPQGALRQSLAALAAARGEPANPRQAEHVATAQWLQGEALLRLNRLDDATRVIGEGLATAQALVPNSKLHGDLTMAKAGAMALRGAAQPALQGFQSAYRIFGAAGQPRGQAMALQNIGSIYQDAGDYQKVMQYYAQSADLYPADPSLAVSAHNNIGRALQLEKKFPEAAAELDKALALARKMGSPPLQANILENLASVEVQWGRLDSAQRHLKEALAITQGDPSAHESEAWVWGLEAQVQLARRQPAAAAQLLGRMFQGVDLTATPMAYRDFHETAYRTFSLLGDDRLALAHLAAFKRLDDQARELAASTNAALMSAQFDYANQASRISELKAGQLQRDIRLARSRNAITTVLLVGSLLIAVLLAVSFLSIRRSRNEVRAANGKLSEANAALAKALRARTEFLAATSHEIRTPLNGILGMTQVLLSRRGLDPAVREQVALVHGSGETMRALVDDILDIARIETDGVTLDRAEIDLPRLCDETVRLWTERAKAKGIALTLDAARAPARIVEDGGRLRQILFNLMSNAIKFTEAGGVSLSVRQESAELGDQIVFTVTDTGIGIPDDKLEEVFESFRQLDSSTTRAYEGTGLGLAICRKLAVAMGGDVYIDSVLGRGTTTTVRLPLARAAVQPADAAAAAVLEDCRLLICDANPLSQSVLKATLQSQVRAVETVTSREAAEAAGGRADLILVDARALGEERQARLAALRSLAGAVSPAVVAVMIADIGEDETGRLLGAGAAQIIRKPITAQALAGELRVGFAERNRAAAPADSLPSADWSMIA